MKLRYIFRLPLKVTLVTLLLSGCSFPFAKTKQIDPTQILQSQTSNHTPVIIEPTDTPDHPGSENPIGIECNRNDGFKLNPSILEDIQIQAYDGSTYNLNEYRGCVIIIHIWSSWCLPCLDQGEVLQQILNEYQQRNVYIFGVTYVDTEPKALSAISEMGVSYPNGPDPGMKIATTLGIAGVPETLVYARDGSLAEVIRHLVTYDELSRTLDRLLK